jgi:hypothetical protein
MERFRLKYNLFLDDERNVADVKWVQYPLVHWVVVRNYQEFVDTVIKNGIPERVSFDHDLADQHYLEYVKSIETKNFDYNAVSEKTGYHACMWLIEYCLEKNIPFPEHYIHTLNPIGRINIQSLIDTYKKLCTI